MALRLHCKFLKEPKPEREYADKNESVNRPRLGSICVSDRFTWVCRPNHPRRTTHLSAESVGEQFQLQQRPFRFGERAEEYDESSRLSGCTAPHTAARRHQTCRMELAAYQRLNRFPSGTGHKSPTAAARHG